MGHLAAVLVLLASTALAAEPAWRARAGDVQAIVRTSQSSQRSSGSSSTSNDRDTLIERVIGVRDGGLELEYSLPKGGDEVRAWQFPARVFKPAQGPLQLLNGPEMEVRIGRWLTAAGLTRAACGHWYFTWNAFRVECDPQSVVAALEPFDLRPGVLRDGAPYQEARTMRPAYLRRGVAGQGAATFVAVLDVDPDAVRKELAASDEALAEIVRKPLTAGDSAQAQAAKEVSGTVTVTFHMDAAGMVQRRVRATELVIRMPDGTSETRTNSEVVERRSARAVRLQRP